MCYNVRHSLGCREQSCVYGASKSKAWHKAVYSYLKNAQLKFSISGLQTRKGDLFHNLLHPSRKTPPNPVLYSRSRSAASLSTTCRKTPSSASLGQEILDDTLKILSLAQRITLEEHRVPEISNIRVVVEDAQNTTGEQKRLHESKAHDVQIFVRVR